MSAAPYLRVVEPHAVTGEVVERSVSLEDRVKELAAETARQQAIIQGLQRDINGWAVRYRMLAADREAEARESPLWPVAELLFGAWRVLCAHPRSPWTEDRFWAIEPFLSRPRYGPTLEPRVLLCCCAIKGAAFDHWKTERRNGTVKHHNEWGQIFHRKEGKQKADGFEEFCCKAPRGWQPTLSPALREAITVAEKRLQAIKEAGRG